MKKLIFTLFAACIIWQNPLWAQFTQVASSTQFDEPERGDVKLLRTPSGATFYLHFEKESLNVKKYDAQHQLVFEKELSYVPKGKTVYSTKSVSVQGENLVGFTYAHEDRTPFLYRWQVNGSNGSLIKTELIGELDKISKSDALAGVFGGVPEPEFYVSLDNESGYYAVALFNTFASDRNKRIEVKYFDPQNALINSSFYESPENGSYKYMTYLDMNVEGANGVYLSSIGKNTKKSGGNQSPGLFVGKLDKAKTSFDMVKMPVVQVSTIENTILKYNKATQRFMMIINKKTKDKEVKKSIALVTFDRNLENVESKPLMLSGVNAIAMKDFKKKEKIEAVPQSLYINADGGYTIVAEEQELDVRTSMSGGPGAMSTRTSVKYYLGDLGIITYDKDGNSISQNYIPKNQKVLSGFPTDESYSQRENAALSMNKGDQYKSYHFINAATGSYILFNDIEDNQENMKNGKKVTTIQDLHATEGFYYKLGKNGIPVGEKVIPSEGKKDRMLIQFVSGHYDKKSNEFAVLITDKKKKSSILWLKPS